jgi:hypothetical protein
MLLLTAPTRTTNAHHHRCATRGHAHAAADTAQEYPEFLQLFFEPLLSQLTSTQPQFEDSELHKLRHGVLEVFAKLPLNDTLRPHLPQLLQVRAACCVACVGRFCWWHVPVPDAPCTSRAAAAAMRAHARAHEQVCLSVLNTDNQANGVIAMRLFLDLNKHLARAQVANADQYFNDAVAFMHKVRARALCGGGGHRGLGLPWRVQASTRCCRCCGAGVRSRAVRHVAHCLPRARAARAARTNSAGVQRGRPDVQRRICGEPRQAAGRLQPLRALVQDGGRVHHNM